MYIVKYVKCFGDAQSAVVVEVQHVQVTREVMVDMDAFVAFFKVKKEK